MQRNEAKGLSQGEDKDVKRPNYIAERIDKDFEMVDRLERLVVHAAEAATLGQEIDNLASEYNQPLAAQASATTSNIGQKAKRKTLPTIYTYNYKQKYATWKTALKGAVKTPTTEQWSLLDAVHRRCKLCGSRR